MDPLDRIDEIIALVESARSVPMSRTNFMFDRGEMVAILDELRAELPGDLRRANALLEERDKIIDAGKREADDGEELCKAIDIALELRRGVAARVNIPAGLGQLRARLIDDPVCRSIARIGIRQPHAIGPAHEAARLD